jgi:hypothetical protein
MAQAYLPLHGKASEIEIAVPKPQVLLGIAALIDHEWKHVALGEDQKILHHHFDLAGGHIRVDHLFRSGPDRAFHGYAVLEPQSRRPFPDLSGRIRVYNDLGKAVPVSEIDEEDAAVVPHAVDPAVQHHPSSHVFRAEGAAVDGSLQFVHMSHSISRM